jgi:hypothetical protein
MVAVGQDTPQCLKKIKRIHGALALREFEAAENDTM